MKQLALPVAVAAAVAAAVAFALPSAAVSAPSPAAASTHRAAQAHSRTCSETYDWERGQTGTAQWAQADWETNTCSHQLQVRVHCATRFGYVSEYSGKVKAVELDARATCPSNEALEQVAIRFSNDGGITWTSWHQLWP